jgi:hypothetical protein
MASRRYGEATMGGLGSGGGAEELDRVHGGMAMSSQLCVAAFWLRMIGIARKVMA